jgi:hypothetical protein
LSKYKSKLNASGSIYPYVFHARRKHNSMHKYSIWCIVGNTWLVTEIITYLWLDVFCEYLLYPVVTTSGYLELRPCVVSLKQPDIHSPTSHFSHFVWTWRLFFVRAWHTTQFILLSDVGQCWRLLSSRRRIFVDKADGLPTGCSGRCCVPANYLISHQCQSEVSVWKFGTTRLQENVAVQNCQVEEMENPFFVHFHVRRLIE